MNSRVNKTILGIVVTFISTSTLLAQTSSCPDRTETFLRSPTKPNYLAIVGSGAKPVANCWAVVGTSQKNRDDLTRLVVQGNPWGIRFVAINLKTLDGGDLEDALRILGEASHSAPGLLLSLNVNGTISDHELAEAATMLPLSFVDKKNESLNELKMRMQGLRSVRDSKLSRPRAYVLKALLSDIRQVEASGPG